MRPADIDPPRTETLDVRDSHRPDPDWLRGRVRDWETARIITREQAGAILELEEERGTPADRAFRSHRVIVVVSMFGGILLAAGLLLLVASNWADIPNIAKAAIALAIVVALEGVGYGLRYHTGYVRTGATFLFVGAVAYGGAIFLVAQTYHYAVDDPRLFLLWFGPVLPLAYLVRSRTIAALGILVGYGALGYWFADWFETHPGLEPYGWPVLLLAVGVAVAAVGHLHGRFEAVRPMGRPYERIGSLTVLVLLYVMSFEGWYDGPRRLSPSVPAGFWLLLAVAVVVTLAVAAVLLSDRRASPLPTLAGVAVPGIPAFLLIGFLLFRPVSSVLVSFAFANLLLLASLVGFVGLGVLTRQETPVNLALVVFALAVASRYLEIGGGMLGTGVSMMLGGALLIGLAWGMERMRRSLLARYEFGGGA